MKIFKVIYYIFIALIVLIALLLIGSILPITGNYKILTVISGSMEPAIKTGSVVIVKPVQYYNIGEIITFGEYSKTKTPTTHRIQDIKLISGQPVYITKGDANNAQDPREVSQAEVIGKVMLSVPYFGYGVDFAKKPLGFALLIIIPATIIIFDEIKKIFIEIKKKKMNP